MATVTERAAPGDLHPLTPELWEVVARRRMTGDVTDLLLRCPGGRSFDFRPGQFNMLTALGVGEVPISISSSPGGPVVHHTVRDVGAVTHALCAARVGSVLGVRGPFGTHWGANALAGSDVVVIAGGIGLAPLRGAIEQLATPGPGSARRLTVLVGARSPGQIVFADDLERWRRRGAAVEVTVDIADGGWRGRVGLVTALLDSATLDPSAVTALVCGPEVMMRFTIRALMDLGVPGRRILLSLERNMQ
ncbi:MAG TPA: FAD/NAD(P)-binding protein, partial [Acidimicrobiales bacterium]|nr:FAD/NAD(P)-binding protein [Acidimicrobiales bacterium]